MRVQLKTAQLESEALRNSVAAIEARHGQELAKKNTELASVAEKSDKEIARLKKTVDAVASGRGRLNELSSLQAELATKEEEWDEERRSLREEIASLSAEVETLAESNQQLISALEGSDNLAAVGSKLDQKSLETRAAGLEHELSSKTAEADRLTQELQRVQAELSEKTMRISTLEERLEGAQKESTLLGSVLQMAKASAEALRKELDGKTQAAAAQAQQVEGEKKELAARVAEADKRLKESQTERDELAAELKKLREAEEERAADIASIRERLNESIQEKWLCEDKLQKLQKEMEREASKPSGAPNMAEVDAKQREMTRRIQDLEGEAKRAKLESQQAKEKLGAHILKQKAQDEETAKLNKLVKQLTDRMVGLESDLAEAEKQCDEYEAILAEMRAAASSAVASE
jgi:chromosome segregation ATPase